MRSVTGVRLGPGASAYQRIISNNSYAHDEQGDNPEQEKGFNGVRYKLWPLQAPWSSNIKSTENEWTNERTNDLFAVAKFLGSGRFCSVNNMYTGLS